MDRENDMKTLKAAILTLTASLALGTAARADDMKKAEYKAAEATIESDYRAGKAACESFSGNAKDICVAEAKGKQDVAKAELVAQNKPSAKHSHGVAIAKSDAIYAIAIERCDDKAGNDKDVCVKEAKAAKVHSLANAETQMKTWKANTAANETKADANTKASDAVAGAKHDAASSKRDADYAVAKEKCAAFAGSIKDDCVAKAKVDYGQ